MDVAMISPNVYQVTLKIVNVFIVRIPVGLILVDTGPAGSKQYIFDAIKRIGNRPDDIKHIIVTHSHHDHSGSLADIVKEVNAPVYMHPHDAMLVRKGVAYRFKLDVINNIVGIITIGSLIRLPYINIKPVKQITEVDDGDWIPGKGYLRVIHSPGHWPGQIALFYPGDGGVIIAADVAENHSRLRLSPGYQNKDECLATIKKISAYDFNIAVFSHGEPILNRASEIFKIVFGLN
jgi:glyoxylase-like metal-dependent hydrolase (beta-lactamase superfamily II)